MNLACDCFWHELDNELFYKHYCMLKERRYSNEDVPCAKCESFLSKYDVEDYVLEHVDEIKGAGSCSA